MLRLLAMSLTALALAGCAGEQAVTGASGSRHGGSPEPMTGRWHLAAAGGSQCVMNFGNASDTAEGTIAPEGGCPGSFYTSRKWAFENGSLVIRDHNGKPLGELAFASPGRFDGKSTGGQPLTLSR